MEYKMRKTMALGAVIMLCAVAIIGVGYAAFSGNARTYNEGNAATAGYMTLVPDAGATSEWASITYTAATTDHEALADFSTYTYNSSGTKTAFYLESPESSPVTVDTTNYVVKSIGSKSFTVTNQTGAAVASVDIVVKQSIAVGNADFVYIIKVGDVYKILSSTTPNTETTFNVTVDTDAGTEGNQPCADESSFQFSIGLYIGYAANVCIPDVGYGAAVPIADKTEAYDQDAILPTGTNVPEDIPVAAPLTLGIALTEHTA